MMCLQVTKAFTELEGNKISTRNFDRKKHMKVSQLSDQLTTKALQVNLLHDCATTFGSP